jgi:hypothetical protein
MFRPFFEMIVMQEGAGGAGGKVTDEDLFSPQGGAAGWQLKTAADGSYFLFNPATGEIKRADTSQLPLAGLIKDAIPVTRAEPIAPLSNEYVQSVGGISGLAPEQLNFITEYLDKSDPRVLARIGRARMNYMTGQMTADDANVLVANGDLTIEQAAKLFRGSGSGGGGADNSLGWAQLAYQRERDRVEDQRELLAAIANFQAAEDQRQLARQQALREAIPYALPAGMEYYPGFAPSDPAVRSGVVAPFRARGIAFDPNAVGQANPYDAQMADALAQYKALIGAA